MAGSMFVGKIVGTDETVTFDKPIKIPGGEMTPFQMLSQAILEGQAGVREVYVDHRGHLFMPCGGTSPNEFWIDIKPNGEFEIGYPGV